LKIWAKLLYRKEHNCVFFDDRNGTQQPHKQDQKADVKHEISADVNVHPVKVNLRVLDFFNYLGKVVLIEVVDTDGGRDYSRVLDINCVLIILKIYIKLMQMRQIIPKRTCSVQKGLSLARAAYSA
jgi:hypothetical protein